MKDMSQRMMESLARQRESRKERSETLWKMSADERVTAMWRNELTRGQLREATTTEHEHDAIPVMHARRRCLYDHLHHLQDLLQNMGMDAQIPIDDAAVEAVEH
jgi:hypothetical protein